MKKIRKRAFLTGALLFLVASFCFSCNAKGDESEAYPLSQWQDEQGVCYRIRSNKKEYVVSSVAEDCPSVVVIPSFLMGLPVTEVERNAFYDKGSLQRVVLPEGIVSVGESAFAACENLTEIELPQSLRLVGNYAFDSENLTYFEENDLFYLGNPNDRYVYLAFSKENIKIANVANGCRIVAARAFFARESLTEAYLPSGVISIERQAFESCQNLEKFVVEKDVERIGSFVFSYCPSLTEIIFQGTAREWESVERIWDWRYYCSVERVVCVDRVLYI